MHDDAAATSEDFWTVGNATKWMLLASRLLDLSPQAPSAMGRMAKDTLDAASRMVGAGRVEPEAEMRMTEAEEGVLASMGVGQGIEKRNDVATAVWKMVMGKDMLQGEGEIR